MGRSAPYWQAWPVAFLAASLVFSGFSAISGIFLVLGTLGLGAAFTGSHHRPSRIAFPAVVLVAVIGLSALVVDSLSPTPSFFAGEGRSLISLLILGGCGRISIQNLRFVRSLLRSVAGVGLVSLLLAISPARDLVLGDSVERVFSGFGSSHHATAFFFGLVALVAWASPAVSRIEGRVPVSYTHLTLPTICSV